MSTIQAPALQPREEAQRQTDILQRISTNLQRISTNWENRKVTIIVSGTFTLLATAGLIAATLLSGGMAAVIAASIAVGLGVIVTTGLVHYPSKQPAIEASRVEQLTPQIPVDELSTDAFKIEEPEEDWKEPQSDLIDPKSRVLEREEPLVLDHSIHVDPPLFPDVPHAIAEPVPFDQPVAHVMDDIEEPVLFDIPEKKPSSYYCKTIAGIGALGIGAAALAYAYSNGYLTSPIPPMPENNNTVTPEPSHENPVQPDLGSSEPRETIPTAPFNESSHEAPVQQDPGPREETITEQPFTLKPNDTSSLTEGFSRVSSTVSETPLQPPSAQAPVVNQPASHDDSTPVFTPEVHLPSPPLIPQNTTTTVHTGDSSSKQTILTDDPLTPAAVVLRPYTLVPEPRIYEELSKFDFTATTPTKPSAVPIENSPYMSPSRTIRTDGWEPISTPLPTELPGQQETPPKASQPPKPTPLPIFTPPVVSSGIGTSVDPTPKTDHGYKR